MAVSPWVGPADDHLATRSMLAGLARQLGRPERAWVILAEGNVAATTSDGTAHVKASGSSMRTADDGDLVSLPLADLLHLIDDPSAGDADVKLLFDRVAAKTGGRRPSVESLLHAVCLDLEGVSVAGHTHPISVNALLCSPRASLLTEGALFPDQVVVLGTHPVLVPYVDPGLALARVVRRLVRGGDGVPRAIYLENHGLFALGGSAAEVLQITEMADKVAAVILKSLPAGGPRFMSEADVRRIDTRDDEIHRRVTLAGARTGDLT